MAVDTEMKMRSKALWGVCSNGNYLLFAFCVAIVGVFCLTVSHACYVEQKMSAGTAEPSAGVIALDAVGGALLLVAIANFGWGLLFSAKKRKKNSGAERP